MALRCSSVKRSAIQTTATAPSVAGVGQEFSEMIMVGLSELVFDDDIIV
jgi:hypothetical protein